MTQTIEVNGEQVEVNVNLLDVLSQAQRDALAQKFAAQPKTVKKAVRANETEGDEATQYAIYILQKTANDYIAAQMRDVWVQRLELLIPRLGTKDAKLLSATENAVSNIALEIEDIDQRADIQTVLKRNLLPKSTDAYTLIQCFDRLAELFNAAWKS